MDSDLNRLDSSNCPECDAQLSVPGDAIQGEIVTCRDCGSAFELVRQTDSGVFALRPAELEEEDWGE
jgi:alpha-aminoadipate/glutamate carrier protein LysW